MYRHRKLNVGVKLDLWTSNKTKLYKTTVDGFSKFGVITPATLIFKETYKPCCCSFRTLGEKTQTSVWYVPALCLWAQSGLRSTVLKCRLLLLVAMTPDTFGQATATCDLCNVSFIHAPTPRSYTMQLNITPLWDPRI